MDDGHVSVAVLLVAGYEGRGRGHTSTGYSLFVSTLPAPSAGVRRRPSAWIHTGRLPAVLGFTVHLRAQGLRTDTGKNSSRVLEKLLGVP
ncbi:hypothetical protein ARTHRO9AX_190082 [Arthrobacter sp. 9AX]|nr:hypothetical protein ARTHRO9AX_190082 [Arthrobacter sp. 9AX]